MKFEIVTDKYGNVVLTANNELIYVGKFMSRVLDTIQDMYEDSITELEDTDKKNEMDKI